VRARPTEKRTDRIARISKALAEHDLKLRQKVRGKMHVLRQRLRKRAGQMADIVAYDLETTRIKAGTPEPLYITAFSDHRNFLLSNRIDSIEHLRELLIDHFIVPEMSGVKFVAWNANNFDVYFIAMALMADARYVLRPYLTKSKSLRGLRVVLRDELELKPNQQKSWEFLDGISMLGLQGKSLKDFLKVFAPEYEKIERESFETKEFDADDPDDVQYAFRDSEGLYFAMMNAQEIIYERFNIGLRATIGNLGIRIFESRIPEGVQIRESELTLLAILRSHVCRGGYCHLMRKYKGPVWKYDLNQAYAAAMREAKLPAGRAYYVKGLPKYAKVYIARITAEHPNNTIPFYCRQTVGVKLLSAFPTTRITDTWLTSIEVDQLVREGWKIRCVESYAWPEHFDMSDYVTALETLRSNAPGGPSGAVGTVIKAIGNNSYGKTLESLEPLELVLSYECPEGFVDYVGEENPESTPYVWCRFVDTPSKNYHQPQIGAFITAHVRMVVRRAALLSPKTFLYADTDCVIFSSDVTKQLDIDPRRYGAFKLEASGEDYLLVAKKVYASGDGKTKHSKGLRVRDLEFADFVDWFAGRIPVQHQAQRQNFLKVMRGSEMFVNRTRKGTAV
jgi:hypothetical protein